jgi:putative tryptophan/tyrosine transport system substrate-binding protein
LHELQPGAVHVAVLVDPNYPLTEFFVSDVQAAASSIKKQIEVLEAPTGRDIDMAFARLAQKPTDALLVGPSPFLNTVAYKSLRWRPTVGCLRSTPGARLPRSAA